MENSLEKEVVADEKVKKIEVQDPKFLGLKYVGRDYYSKDGIISLPLKKFHIYNILGKSGVGKTFFCQHYYTNFVDFKSSEECVIPIFISFKSLDYFVEEIILSALNVYSKPYQKVKIARNYFLYLLKLFVEGMYTTIYEAKVDEIQNCGELMKLFLQKYASKVAVNFQRRVMSEEGFGNVMGQLEEEIKRLKRLACERLKVEKVQVHLVIDDVQVMKNVGRGRFLYKRFNDIQREIEESSRRNRRNRANTRRYTGILENGKIVKFQYLVDIKDEHPSVATKQGKDLDMDEKKFEEILGCNNQSNLDMEKEMFELYDDCFQVLSSVIHDVTRFERPKVEDPKSVFDCTVVVGARIGNYNYINRMDISLQNRHSIENYNERVKIFPIYSEQFNVKKFREAFAPVLDILREDPKKQGHLSKLIDDNKGIWGGNEGYPIGCSPRLMVECEFGGDLLTELLDLSEQIDKSTDPSKSITEMYRSVARNFANSEISVDCYKTDQEFFEGNGRFTEITKRLVKLRFDQPYNLPNIINVLCEENSESYSDYCFESKKFIEIDEEESEGETTIEDDSKSLSCDLLFPLFLEDYSKERLKELIFNLIVGINIASNKLSKYAGVLITSKYVQDIGLVVLSNGQGIIVHPKHKIYEYMINPFIFEILWIINSFVSHLYIHEKVTGEIDRDIVKILSVSDEFELKKYRESKKDDIKVEEMKIAIFHMKSDQDIYEPKFSFKRILEKHAGRGIKFCAQDEIVFKDEDFDGLVLKKYKDKENEKKNKKKIVVSVPLNYGQKFFSMKDNDKEDRTYCVNMIEDLDNDEGEEEVKKKKDEDEEGKVEETPGKEDVIEVPKFQSFKKFAYFNSELLKSRIENLLDKVNHLVFYLSGERWFDEYDIFPELPISMIEYQKDREEKEYDKLYTRVLEFIRFVQDVIVGKFPEVETSLKPKVNVTIVMNCCRDFVNRELNKVYSLPPIKGLIKNPSLYQFNMVYSVNVKEKGSNLSKFRKENFESGELFFFDSFYKTISFVSQFKIDNFMSNLNENYKEMIKNKWLYCSEDDLWLFFRDTIVYSLNNILESSEKRETIKFKDLKNENYYQNLYGDYLSSSRVQFKFAENFVEVEKFPNVLVEEFIHKIIVGKGFGDLEEFLKFKKDYVPGEDEKSCVEVFIREYRDQVCDFFLANQPELYKL